MIAIRTQEEIGKLRASAAILTAAFEAVRAILDVGVSTAMLDKVAEKTILEQGGIPAFKGYNGFPATICASVNQQVVHGIPGDRELRAGEIISIDIGVKYQGYYSDAAMTYPVGAISPDVRDLLDTTAAALHKGIQKCRAGNRLSDISHAVQTKAEKNGYSVVRDLVGHGIGTALHEPPQIPNYGAPGQGPTLREGMVFAIEPMVNMGGHEIVFLEDGWTVESEDGSLSAHFEHTVVVTGGKPEILTIAIENHRD
ncbi:type I methionyl aminopeptidase [bacterium]|nr:type I methionyl aminopeptidase [bacterium]